MQACKRLIRSRAFEKVRQRGGYWQVVVDGSQLYSSREKPDGKCLYRVHNKGTEKEYTEYYYYVLEAKLILHRDICVSILTEFAENQEEAEKQDCELKAFYSLIKRLREQFPMLPVCICGDSLYAGGPFFTECRNADCRYLLRFREGSIPSVYDGYDGEGKPRYCALRAPSSERKFRQDVENSDKTYGFCMEGRSDRVYEFEAPIDAMSHATLCKLYGIDWREDHRVAEGCLSDKALSRYLKSHPEIREIVFCYDNDVDGKDANGQPRNHGQVQANQSAEAFKAGYKIFIQTPQTKDFNEDLLTFREMSARSRDGPERAEAEELETAYP